MNKPTFEKTVNILVKAYLNGTLVHGNCFACAVGNIVADSFGVKSFIQGRFWLHWQGFDEETQYPASIQGEPVGWGSVFCTNTCTMKQEIKIENYSTCAEAKRQIDSTGYTVEQLARVEEAFESADGYGEERMFSGLMLVVDVLAEIHGIDLKVREDAKSLFVKV